MNEPLKAGDLAIVIDGLNGLESPNINKIVTVGKLIGEHSLLGRMRHCIGPDIVQMNAAGQYVKTGWADFPIAWLKKIEPPPLKVKDKNLELTE